MIVAAGGSGGAAKAEGAPGRDQNRRYRNCEGKSALLNQTCSNYKELVSRLTIQNSGNVKICYGQDGKYSGTVPASGGGGGYQSGISTNETSGFYYTYDKSVAHSGSSCMPVYRSYVKKDSFPIENCKMEVGVNTETEKW